MEEKDIIKTVFSFFIVDILIFAVFSFIIGIVIGVFLEIGVGSIGGKIGSFISLILFLTLIWGNYKYRYKGKSQEDEALKVLKLRYAKGEIPREEYEQMKKDISGL